MKLVAPREGSAPPSVAFRRRRCPGSTPPEGRLRLLRPAARSLLVVRLWLCRSACGGGSVVFFGSVRRLLFGLRLPSSASRLLRLRLLLVVRLLRSVRRSARGRLRLPSVASSQAATTSFEPGRRPRAAPASASCRPRSSASIWALDLPAAASSAPTQSPSSTQLLDLVEVGGDLARRCRPGSSSASSPPPQADERQGRGGAEGEGEHGCGSGGPSLRV